MKDLVEMLATQVASMPEPTNSSIEDLFAYWGIRLTRPLKVMFTEEGISVDQMDKFTQVLKEFVPKLEEIIKGEK